MANYEEHYKDLENISSKDYEILMEVALANKYPVERLIKAYGIESSYGTNPKMNTGSYQGPFQFSINTGGEFGLIDESTGRDDRQDLRKSAQAYIESINVREKRMKNMINNETGNLDWVESLDPNLRDYLLHQQGGRGLAQLSLAREGYQDYYFRTVRPRIKPQLSKGQWDYFVNKTKSPEEAIDYYMNIYAKKANIRR